MHLLIDATIYLAAAVLAVPLFRSLGLGSVLGYLAAGIVIGPRVLALVHDPQSILHFAEIGVVFLLFVIGLELRPSRLWVLRRSVFGVGGLQLLTAAVSLAGIALVLGFGSADALVIGLALGLSSTAFVLQLLAEKGELTSSPGRAAFGILLFQDLAVIPILAVLPFLGAPEDPVGPPDPWWHSLVILAALVAFIAGGRYFLRPALRLVVLAKTREIFVAATLLLVLGAALAMEHLGVSMALGAFVAGVLLADSEYRHELEAAIDPFKGLLLGLFFMSVGMTLDLGLLVEQPVFALGAAALLMLVKFVLLFAVGRMMGFASGTARRTAILLSQGGEFAFVILGAAGPFGLLDPESSRMTILIVTLSMALTPLVVLVDDRLLTRWFTDVAPERLDEPAPKANPVIIAGFGRVGQVVARVLRAKGVSFTALERDPTHLDFVRRFGNRVYFGDAGQLEVLRAAGAEEAKLLVVAVNYAQESARIVRMVRKHFPGLRVYAAARNRQHALALRECGAAYVVRVAFGSSLELSEAVLRGLDSSPEQAERVVSLFRQHDEETLDRQFEFRRDDDALMLSARESEEELKLLIDADDQIDAAEVESPAA